MRELPTRRPPQLTRNEQSVTLVMMTWGELPLVAVDLERVLPAPCPYRKVEALVRDQSPSSSGVGS